MSGELPRGTLRFLLAAGLVGAAAALTGRSPLPRWTAVLNPIFLMLVLTGVGFVLPVTGPFIGAGAGTLAHSIFLAVCALILWRGHARGSAGVAAEA